MTGSNHNNYPSAQLRASTFNQQGQYANSSGNRAYCYAKLAVPSQAVAVSNHC